jgi:dynein assembly factor 1
MPTTLTSTNQNLMDSTRYTFERLRERERERFQQERKGQIPKMDAETLREICLENDGYENPELNDNLYAHFRGFQKIEGLEKYFNLKALWLESNGLSRIENLSPLVNLRCLYLGKNLIETIENLEPLEQLNTLDLSENRIMKITGLSKLKNLTNLNLSRNLIEDVHACEELVHCQTLTNIDISHNHLEEDQENYFLFKILQQMPNLKALRITGNGLVSKIKYFRKVYISNLPHLSFLDRPIFEMEKKSVEAWQKGGNEAELKAKQLFIKQQNDERKKHLQEFRQWQQEVREKATTATNVEILQQEEEQENIMTKTNQQKEEEEKINLYGFRGITKEQYRKLSQEEKIVWDQRIQQAHLDSQQAKAQVLGEGIKQMGTNFWSKKPTVANANVNAPIEVEEVVEKEQETKVEEVEKQLETIEINQNKKQPAENARETPSLSPPPPLPAPVVTMTTTTTTTASAPAKPATVRAPEAVALPPAPVPIQASFVSTNASELPTPPEDPVQAPVFQSDPKKFFKGMGEARESWNDLERRARETPFLHRPQQLPSIELDDDEEDEVETDGDDDATQDSERKTSSNFPLKALTREEILKDLLAGKSTLPGLYTATTNTTSSTTDYTEVDGLD